MKKGVTRRKVLGYIRKNPKAKAKEVAQAVGVSISCVYNVKSQAKKAYEEAHGKAVSKVTKALNTIGVGYKVDNVNHPPHYKVGGIEVIDFIESKKFNYNLGNVIKYVSRADHKGNRLEDLQKARWYLDREIGGLS